MVVGIVLEGIHRRAVGVDTYAAVAGSGGEGPMDVEGRSTAVAAVRAAGKPFHGYV